MPLSNDINSIIVAAGSANFSAHTYTEVYAGAGITATINGVSVVMAAGSSLRIIVRSISNTANCYLLGETKDNYTGSVLLG